MITFTLLLCNKLSAAITKPHNGILAVKFALVETAVYVEEDEGIQCTLEPIV